MLLCVRQEEENLSSNKIFFNSSFKRTDNYSRDIVNYLMEIEFSLQLNFILKSYNSRQVNYDYSYVQVGTQIRLGK